MKRTFLKKTLRILLIGWLVFSFLHVGFDVRNRFFSGPKQATADELSETARLLGTVLNLINKYYVDEVKLRDIVYPAIKEMVSHLDQHSHFLTPEENQKLKDEEKAVQEYAGLGMMLGYRQNRETIKEAIKSDNFDIDKLNVEIKKVFDGSPAQKAGLLPKDEIVAIDGVPMNKIGAEEVAKAGSAEKKVIEKTEQVVKMLKGPAGSSVTVTIKREGWPEPKDFSITRAQIRIKNVEWKIIPDAGKRFGYLKISGFMAGTTAEEVKKAVKEFKTEKVDGAIIDLRNNPGGRLDFCLEVLENFLPPDALCISVKGRTGEDQYYTGNNYSEYFSKPLVILINEGSASASEIVSGVLRDHKKAILVGEKTYGKGSVQAVFNLPDGSSLRLTIQKYFLPSGECIHEKGIPADIQVKTEFDEPMINEALKVLKDWETYKDKILK